MELDKSKIKLMAGGVEYDASSTSAGNYDVYYNGEMVGRFHRVSGYPARVTTPKGKYQSFVSPFEAIKFLVCAAKGVALDANIFPDGYYILRVHDMMLAVDPEPNAPIRINAKMHYNSKNSTGSSAASKPSNSEMVVIDLEARTISTKKNLTFVNKDEIIDKVAALFATDKSPFTEEL